MKSFINKYKKLSITARASIWYTFCNIIQRAISFLVIPIYTGVLTTTEYGKYTVFQSWREILLIFATLNLYCGMFTKAMVDYEDDRDKYTSSMQTLSTVLSVVLATILIVGHETTSRVLEMDNITLVMMFVYFIFYPAFSFWSVRQRVENKYISMVIVTLAMAVLTPIVSLYLLFYSALGVNAVIWGYLLVQIVFGFYFYVYNYIKGKCIFKTKYWIEALKYNIPLIPHYLSLIVLGQADRIMIQKMCGDDKAGIYGLAYTVAQLMLIFTNAVNSAIVPWIYGQLKKGMFDNISKLTKKICILFSILTFAFCLIAPEIVLFLGNEEYLEAIWIIPVVALSVYVTFCYGLFSNIEFYYKATNYVMIASTLGAVVNIILNYIFINKSGYLAAGYTTLVCYLLFMILHFFFMRNVCKKNNITINVYDNKFIFVSILLLMVLMCVCFLLYINTIVRYIIVFIGIVVLVMLRKKVIFILMELKNKED